LSTAKCTHCGGDAEGETFEIAARKINHAVGLSRGIKCGTNYNRVIDTTPKEEPKPEVTKKIKEPQKTQKPIKKQKEEIIKVKEESTETQE